MYTKEIVYDRETCDYALYLDGELVGFARTYHEAEVTLDQLVCELLSEQFVAEAPAAPAEVHARPAEPAPEPVYVSDDADGSVDPYAPLGECSQCGAAAWTTTAAGLLCPDHDGVLSEWIAPVEVSVADWGAYNTGSIDACACGKAAVVLLHGVCADADIALCGVCHAAYAAPATYARPAEPAPEPVYVPVLATRHVSAGWSAEHHDDLAAIAAQVLLPLAHLSPYVNARGDYVSLGWRTEIPAPRDDHAIVVCLIDALNDVAAQLPLRPDSINAALHIGGELYMVSHNGPRLLPDVAYARPADLAPEPIYVALTDRLDHAVKTDLAATIAASPSLMDTTITGALETFTDDAQRLLDQALAQELRDKDEIGYWRAQRNAFAKALHYFSSEGVRLNPTPSGYTVPSASRAGAVIHRLWRVGGVWHCSCEAGERGIFHWHTALIAGYDRALDLLELEGGDEEVEQDRAADWNGYTDPETGYDADDYADEAPAAALGQRLAWARAEIEINELFA